MPSLVEKTETGKRGGIWEVKWTWMPAFLAMDKDLVKMVDARLNQIFAGGEPPMPRVLAKVVMDTICQRYPMSGLREVLEAIQRVDPAVRLRLVDSEAITETLETPRSSSSMPSSEMTTPTESSGSNGLSMTCSPSPEESA